MHISIIVPAHDSAAELPRCLSALLAPDSGVEVIVVDDASTDQTAEVATRMGARLLRLPRKSGPAAARNRGAAAARGDILLFVDADVVLAPGAVARVARAFEEAPGLAAMFGSYDEHPAACSLVSQYRNLLHHFVHQQGKRDASTFWAGCGAVRREVFERAGGFDEVRFREPSVEDIELGMRLRQAGHRILLDKELQGTHLKRWTLRSVLATDVLRRAIPWSRLIVETGGAPDDLNVSRSQRWSVALVTLAAAISPLAVVRIEWSLVPAMAIPAVTFLNRNFYAFLASRRGLRFAAACVPLHLLHLLGSGLGFAGVWLTTRLGRARPRMASLPGHRA